MRYFIKRGFTSLVVVLCFCLSAHAQNVTLKGQVVDKSGAPVPNARMLLIDLSTLEIKRASADKKGAFEFGGLRRTPYEVKAAYQGFVTGSAKVFDFGTPIAVVESNPSPTPPITMNLKITLQVGGTT